MPVPPRTQRPMSRTQPVGPVALKKLPKRHSFQGSRSQPVKKAAAPMPSGMPMGQLAPPNPLEGLNISEPQSPLDVIGSSQASPSPLGNMPGMNTMMQPSPQQWQSGNSMMSNATATNAVNKNMMAGRMPGGPRAATPVGLPPGPAGPGPGGNPGPAAGPPAIFAQQAMGKQGSPFEFGKRALEMPPGPPPGQPHQPMDPKMIAVLSLLAGGGAGIAGGGMGAMAGGMLGTGVGALRGDAVEGLGRGVIRGGLTGAGAGLGGGIGGALGALTGNKDIADGGAALGALGGGALGYMGGGAMLGKPKGRKKQSAAFNFGTDIARTMKPKQVTRTTGEYRGNDMKSNLRKAGC